MSDRKKDHIELAQSAQIKKLNDGFYYEPMLSAHPTEVTDISINFLGKRLLAPLWVSSMTGGTQKAKLINTNLAKAANQFGLGMGLGSCRSLLNSDERKSDFALRDIIGDQPFYANLGVAQLEDFLIHHKLHLVKELLENLQVDGLIIHVNPLQEWMQPEGDRFKMAPIDTIKQCLLELETKIIVKEVGQGFGPNSLISLMKLPLAAIDFAGHGGTNFTALELSRHSALSSGKRDALSQLSYVGHRPEEMIQWANEALHGHDIKCKEFIISGGISDALTGHRLRELLEANSVIGMGNAFLKVAEHYDELCEFITVQIELLKLAKCYLKGR